MPLVASLPIRPNSKIVVLGDSITFQNWQAGLITAVAAQQPLRGSRSAQVGNPRRRRASAMVAGGTVYTGTLVPTWTNSGEFGGTVITAAADITARVTTFAPTVLITFFGVNEAQAGSTAAAMTTAYGSIFTAARAVVPTIDIMMITPWLYGEKWPTGANSLDTVANGMDAQAATIRTIAAAQSCTLVDVRAAVMAALPALNPANVQNGILTSDDAHPNATGKAWLVAQVLAKVTVSKAIP